MASFNHNPNASENVPNPKYLKLQVQYGSDHHELLLSRKDDIKIGHVQDEIERITKVPKCHQTIVYKGQRLDHTPDARLDDLYIFNNSKLQLAGTQTQFHDKYCCPDHLHGTHSVDDTHATQGISQKQRPSTAAASATSTTTTTETTEVRPLTTSSTQINVRPLTSQNNNNNVLTSVRSSTQSSTNKNRPSTQSRNNNSITTAVIPYHDDSTTIVTHTHMEKQQPIISGPAALVQTTDHHSESGETQYYQPQRTIPETSYLSAYAPTAQSMYHSPHAVSTVPSLTVEKTTTSNSSTTYPTFSSHIGQALEKTMTTTYDHPSFIPDANKKYEYFTVPYNTDPASLLQQIPHNSTNHQH
ncbi:unnamed protein product [Didymodactylos carnosus]|uniref:Ubiquitin-like domain-containing protein n=1 Tax=Didymodactylos carnosus TaxID=1234261 RepID=A0A813PUN2_9BILA|nr:unnamed protein product [Didymodactylos carnosus]CAF0789301.1 unnamed protein product [Didymodactylos carnosus]CAF3541290.1 unnamed protein product [Didymodactylos carnosus]CAF3571750.1 unnamed protein product [Didymodactylos carnosus]